VTSLTAELLLTEVVPVSLVTPCRRQQQKLHKTGVIRSGGLVVQATWRGLLHLRAMDSLLRKVAIDAV